MLCALAVSWLWCNGWQMNGISSRLQHLLEENASSEPVDRLDRLEFCVDVTGKQLIEEEYRQKAKALQASIAVVRGR